MTIRRLLLLGPMTGSATVAVQVTAAFLCWILNDKPDFYFHGWSGVQVHYMTMLTGGAIVGLPYGIVISLFERTALRRVRLRLVIPALLVNSFAMASVIVYREFEQHSLLVWECAQYGCAIFIGLIFSMILSRRVA